MLGCMFVPCQAALVQEYTSTKATSTPASFMTKKKTPSLHFRSFPCYSILQTVSFPFDAIAQLVVPNFWMTRALTRFGEMTLFVFLDIWSLLKLQTRWHVGI
jgi:hypothetical protein